MQDIAARTDGRLRLGPATLYGSIKRMLHDGLIEELDERPDPDKDDVRRRYYRITPHGRRVAMEETARLTKLVRQARATGLAPKTSRSPCGRRTGSIVCSCGCTPPSSATSTRAR